MNNHPISEKSQSLMRAATIASVAVAAMLIALKTGAWFMTGSVSILSSLMDSVMDVAVSAINLMAVRYALVPPDDEHRFGHYAAEDVAAMLQAAFIAGSGLLIFIESVDRLFTPVVLVHSNIGLAVMAISIIATTALVKFQKHTTKQTGSTAIEADSMHYSTDIVHNIGVIIALAASSFLGWHFIDPIIAMLIAAYMLYGAYQIGAKAFHHLLDKEFPEAERRIVEQILSAHQGIDGFHGLKTRRSGMQSYIQCHLEMEGSLNLVAAKAIDRELKASMREKFPGADIIFQYDPVKK